ncbi:hypothetical protein EF888_06520 [Silicimonas algicola]|uniref:hypothetical protein n=1 Tax=Silicimonas algicola TaxID=1826607 RepID=UPI000F8538D6|nr:hypothetical protein [Silicimonas algicola]AZQ66823.1 hypothetical protein EF888_06520 [Silicimonas algicola]
MKTRKREIPISELPPLVFSFYRETPTWDREAVEKTLRKQLASKAHCIFEGNAMGINYHGRSSTFELYSLLDDDQLNLSEADFWEMVRGRSVVSKL